MVKLERAPRPNVTISRDAMYVRRRAFSVHAQDDSSVQTMRRVENCQLPTGTAHAPSHTLNWASVKQLMDDVHLLHDSS